MPAERRPSPPLLGRALALSVALHVGALGVVFERVRAPVTSDAGTWVGNTFDIAALETTNPPTTNERAAAEPATPEPAKAEPTTAESARSEPTRTEPAAESADASTPSTPRDAPAEAPAKRPGAIPAATTNRTATTPTESAEDAASEAPGGRFGAEGTESRRGRLVDAVTRALPLAALSVKTWHLLPLGAAGASKVRLELDDAGALTKLEPDAEVPEHLDRALKSLRLLLRSGRFRLESTGAKYDRLAVSVTLERVPGVDSLEGDSIEHLEADYAEPSRPGRALVTYRSGLRLRFEVRSLDD